MVGKHILAEFYQCECDTSILTDENTAIALIKQNVIENGLTVVGEITHGFANEHSTMLDNANHQALDNNPANTQTSGYTFSLLLAESHICVHTWDEFRSVTLDIYVCNFLQDNSDKVDNILAFCKKLYLPTSTDIKTIDRYHTKHIDL